jgi:hypothetical protein
MREAIFAAVLLAAGALVVLGVALLFVPFAPIVGGLLLAGWAWLVLSAPKPSVEVPE